MMGVEARRRYGVAKRRRRQMARWTAACVLLLATFAGGCSSDEPCQDYIDYMCDCHDGEEGFSCKELEDVYGDADQEVQDECAIAHDEEKEADKEDDICGGGSTGTTGTGGGTGGGTTE
jgi:hypothetical protein